jgi:hypothetical protein
LSAVPAVRSGRLALLALRGARRRREERTEHLHALEEQLDARAVDAGDDGERIVGGVGRDDRELVSSDADTMST